MLVKNLLMRQDQFIMIAKKKDKGIFGIASKEEIKELTEEGIDTGIIPWADDKNN